MAEIKTPPVIGEDEDGTEVVCFNENHTLSDIVRWLMENTADAEDVHRMLGEELERASSAVH